MFNISKLLFINVYTYWQCEQNMLEYYTFSCPLRLYVSTVFGYCEVVLQQREWKRIPSLPPPPAPTKLFRKPKGMKIPKLFICF